MGNSKIKGQKQNNDNQVFRVKIQASANFIPCICGIYEVLVGSSGRDACQKPWKNLQGKVKKMNRHPQKDFDFGFRLRGIRV